MMIASYPSVTMLKLKGHRPDTLMIDSGVVGRIKNARVPAPCLAGSGDKVTNQCYDQTKRMYLSHFEERDEGNQIPSSLYVLHIGSTPILKCTFI